MFWRVPGFSQPSPIEQILDKDEFTLEELLDEDDLIQECKSLNGRLVAFLRERSTVEQLLRLLVEPPKEDDGPKRTYKYPFTACEVFCCELEGVFNTLLEDAELMSLLFSLLSNSPPLSCKTAGYFGRVVNSLLLRKSNKTMQYLKDHEPLLGKLVSHIETKSVADVLKRMVGAEQFSTPEPAHTQWLSEANLIDLLLGKLADSASADAQTNAAGILTAIANTQPSPLAATLSREESIAGLFEHALSPGKQVMVSAIEVCIALIDPHRNPQEADGLLTGEEPPSPLDATEVKDATIKAIIPHLPKLVDILRQEQTGLDVKTTYGVVHQRLGLPRLKIVELFVVLIRSGRVAAEEAVMEVGAITVCLELFQANPFNNVLHHNVSAMLLAILMQSSEPFLKNLFEQDSFLDWLLSLPVNVSIPVVEGEDSSSPSSSRPPIRAGYMGHATQIGGIVDSISQQRQTSSSALYPFLITGDVAHPGYVQGHPGWQTYLDEILRPRLSLENTACWTCGRPAAGEIPGLDSDGDDFSHGMDLDQLSSMQPASHPRYTSLEENDDEDDDENDLRREAGNFNAADYGLSDAVPMFSAMGLTDEGDAVCYDDEDNVDGDAQVAGRSNSESGVSGQQGLGDDDNVLLASSDDEEVFVASEGNKSATGSPAPASSPGTGVQAVQGEEGSPTSGSDAKVV
eukprot:gene31232-6382_t